LFCEFNYINGILVKTKQAHNTHSHAHTYTHTQTDGRRVENENT